MNAPDPLPNTPYKIVRIYLKGASSEVPDMASVPRQAISPHVGVDMQTLAAPAWPGALECVLRISLHARLEGKTVFMIEVSVAGVFELDVGDMEEAHRFVRKIAPSVLFPFARKDLASLAVAAGFQPVLLDHIDFDTMLAQVMKSQRLTRSAAPMRLDVIAAKPVAHPAPPTPPSPAKPPSPPPPSPPPPAAVPAALDWSDTQPAPLPIPLPAPANRSPAKAVKAGAAEERELPLMATSRPPVPDTASQAGTKPKLRNKALALVCIAGVGAMIAWWMQPKPAGMNEMAVASNAPGRAKAPVAAVSSQAAAPTPVIPAAPTAPVASAETLRAIDASKERLADQPANWFTLDLGLGPVDTPLASWYPAAADRPMFVKAAKDGSIRLLYGVFPSKAAAEQVKGELTRPATVVTIGSL